MNSIHGIIKDQDVSQKVSIYYLDQYILVYYTAKCLYGSQFYINKNHKMFEMKGTSQLFWLQRAFYIRGN